MEEEKNTAFVVREALLLDYDQLVLALGIINRSRFVVKDKYWWIRFRFSLLVICSVVELISIGVNSLKLLHWNSFTQGLIIRSRFTKSYNLGEDFLKEYSL